MRIFTFLACLLYLSGYAQKSQKPNIIYIFADDLGYGELGCYGQQRIKTPHLDQLAKEGIRFTQHYTSTPVCAPSRCQLLTGKHSGHAYIRANYEMGGFADSLEGGQMPLHPNAFTIGNMLQQVGYQTACIGKWGLGMGYNTGSPTRQGFDYFYGYYDQKQAHNHYPTHLWENEKYVALNNHPIDVHKGLDSTKATLADFEHYRGNDYAMDKMAEKAQQFVKQNQQRPFFLYLPFTAPHLSLQAPQKAIDPYIRQFEDKPYYGQNGYAATPYPKATYAAMITEMDRHIGELIALLKKLNLDDNTLIMFSSDNGATFSKGVFTQYFNSVGNLRGLKMDLYEGGTRVPMIARWHKKIAPNQTTDLISAQYDVMATLAEIVGYKLTDTDGISFLPTLLGKPQQQKKHEYLYWEYPEKGPQIAIRMGKWKAIKTDLRKNSKAQWQLYDLHKDPSETTDVASQHPELLPQFDAIVKREHTPAHLNEWEFINSKIVRK